MLKAEKFPNVVPPLVEVNALKREPCGLPEPEDRCACERRGCCWGADDPFASGIPGVAKCYFLYGGPGQVPYPGNGFSAGVFRFKT